MAEIAIAADVSVPTVSKVLNGRVDVAAETRRRVEELLQASGYLRGRRQRERDPWLIDLVFSEFGPTPPRSSRRPKKRRCSTIAA